MSNVLCVCMYDLEKYKFQLHNEMKLPNNNSSFMSTRGTSDYKEKCWNNKNCLYNVCGE